MTTSNTPIYASQARPWLKFYDQKYIDQTMPACTAFELVCRQNKNRLGETALEYYGRKFTYADFIVNVKKTAAALRAAGLKKGDIATVVSVMTPEIIFAFYAADMIGATLNLVDPRYSVEGIREYIEEVDSHLLICLNVVYERCHQAAKRTHVEHVVVLSPADSLPLPLALGYKVKNLDKNKYHSNVIHWKQFLAAGKDESIAAEPYDPEHACVVVHTGGTTGSPKGVMPCSIRTSRTPAVNMPRMAPPSRINPVFIRVILLLLTMHPARTGGRMQKTGTFPCARSAPEIHPELLLPVYSNFAEKQERKCQKTLKTGGQIRYTR